MLSYVAPAYVLVESDTHTDLVVTPYALVLLESREGKVAPVTYQHEEGKVAPITYHHEARGGAVGGGKDEIAMNTHGEHGEGRIKRIAARVNVSRHTTARVMHLSHLHHVPRDAVTQHINIDSKAIIW